MHYNNDIAVGPYFLLHNGVIAVSLDFIHLFCCRCRKLLSIQTELLSVVNKATVVLTRLSSQQGALRGQQDPRKLNVVKQLQYVGAMSDALLGECEGDCSMDADCADGLACFQRADQGASEVPGCVGGSFIGNFDFCYRHNPYYGPLVFVSDSPTAKLGACQGDCGEWIRFHAELES